LIVDRSEIEAIIRELRDTSESQELSPAAKIALRRPGYQGVVVELISSESGQGETFRVLKGCISNGRSKCFKDKRKLESYLVDMILNSSESNNMTLGQDLVDSIRASARLSE
jgi:hypothetical protein